MAGRGWGHMGGGAAARSHLPRPLDAPGRCDTFSNSLTLHFPRSPYIIGTMNQATSSTPNLQLHHNFR